MRYSSSSYLNINNLILEPVQIYNEDISVSAEISHKVGNFEIFDYCDTCHEILNFKIICVLLYSDQHDPSNQFNQYNHSNWTADQPSASSDRFRSCFLLSKVCYIKNVFVDCKSQPCQHYWYSFTINAVIMIH